MIFNLFSRRRDSTQPPQSIPQDGHTPDRAQLRTPSPSVLSTSVVHHNASSIVGSVMDQEPPLTPSPPPEDQTTINLCTLIQSIPPQTLHTYTLAQLLSSDASSSDTIRHVSSFFSELVPPPRLHCARCHRSYFEVENVDRSCLVPHDDESTEVQRVNLKEKGTQHETLWGCCGKVVEGDGDQGPPDGWCYEGKHTTDSKRARFRADSTPQDDKLVSCERKRCHTILRSSLKRKRAADDTSNIEDVEDAASSGLSTSPRSVATSTKRRRSPKKPRTQTAPPESTLPPPPTVNGRHSADQVDADGAPPPSSNTPHSPPPASTLPLPPRSKSPTKPVTPRPRPRAASSRHAKSKSLSMPTTSSPLAVNPAFGTRSVSPDTLPPVIVVRKAQPADSPVKPRSSRKKKKKAAAAAEAGNDESTPSKQRHSVDEALPKDSPGLLTRRAAAKAKALEEVVDSSVASERKLRKNLKV